MAVDGEKVDKDKTAKTKLEEVRIIEFDDVAVYVTRTSGWRIVKTATGFTLTIREN